MILRCFPEGCRHTEAVEYAKSLCVNPDVDDGVEYACHQGQLFDGREQNSNYGRVAVDAVEFFE